MKFIDETIITVKSGDGGAGCVSFRRERFIPKGGPDGGDGGNGGSIIFKVDQNKRTLFDFWRQKIIKAKNGRSGLGKQKHGKNGKSQILNVPPGTIFSDVNTGKVIKDLTKEEDQFIAAKGGLGGKGNKRFSTSTNRTPRYAQPGIPGTELKLKLELKLLADVGIIGLPNAGKSTLISQISSARPKIADYPFTTLTPSLGMVIPEYKEPFAVVDIPGLIKGAHDGTGLGIQFLKHVERTSILIHLIDTFQINPDSPLSEFNLINKELFLYSPLLAQKPQIIVLNKIDIIDIKKEQNNIEIFKKAYKGKSKILTISAITGKGTRELIKILSQEIL